MANFKIGETAYFIESNMRVTACSIVSCAWPFVTISFKSQNDTDGVIRIRETRLYRTQEEAEEAVKALHPGKRTTRW